MAKAEKNQVFEREFKRLNSKQKEAVRSIEGPVMVVAGPGTGKTQVVAMRIAEILTQTQLNARNILALTFTEAGVTALRRRLETIIGTDAYQVTISTFHGFANEVVVTFPYIFGFTVEAMQVSELERLQLIHEIIESKTALKALRPVRAPTFHVATVADSIRKVKQENISPQELRRLAKEQFTKQSETAKMTALQRQTVERQWQLNQELAEVYEQYQKILKSRNLYDYEDMILFAVEGLKSEPDVRSYYQERYQYVLVDEYQDTNNAQNNLVDALTEFYQNPNLFVVGDDKQAIYRFQGASVANMLHFARKYPQLKVIALEENYRSSPKIVEVATELIENNQHQLTAYLKDLRPKLSATRDDKKSQLKLVSFPSDETQFSWIVQRIRDLARQGVKYEEIAVLFRRNDEVRAFREYAQKSGLAVAGMETLNILSEPEVQHATMLLRAIENPSDAALLSLSLQLTGNHSPITLARLARAQYKEKSLDDAVESLELATVETQKLRNSIEIIKQWAALKTTLALPELIERVVCESEILRRIYERPDALERLETLKAFLNEAKRFALQRPGNTLKDFLDYILLLRNYRVRLNVHRLSPTLEGVFVATAHGAKGLEFDTVFLPNSSTDSWNDRTKRELIKLPAAITGLSAWSESATEDERRLFYVALTRAKNKILISYPRFNGDGKELLPSQFVSEIMKHVESEDFQPTQEQAKAVLATALSPIPAITLKDQEKRVIRDLITHSPFSYTDYKTYKLCPQQYLLNCVLKFPTLPDARLVYGSILHRALELFYKQYRTRKALPSKATLISYLEQASRQSEMFKGKAAVLDQAKTLLGAYYDSLASKPVVPAAVEYSLTSHHVLLDSIWVTGKFDRIDPIDPLARTVKIVDYKTGSQAQTRNQIEGKTKDSEGLLREQLVFYSMLISRDPNFPYVATEFALKFLDDKHTFREESFAIKADEREKLAAEVIATYQEILSSEKFIHSREQFDKGCELCEVFSTLA